MGKGLVMMHIDGVGHRFLVRALEEGRMPKLAALMRSEGYDALPYRCGIPSTTPFCQAGILYGDNSEIPSYRWWDKEANLLVAFGHGSSFKKVAGKYFQGREPLTQDGAVIGSCYPAGARDTFALAYRERDTSGGSGSGSSLALILAFFSSPLRVAAWLRHGIMALVETAAMAIRARLQGHHPERAYVISDMLEEIFLHHVARYAVRQAMKKGFPTIYAGFYAYDETAHGFGPEDGYCYRMLGHVDHTIGEIAAHRAGHGGTPSDYELVILSDHGQVESEPFNHSDGKTLGEIISGHLPDHSIQEYKGGRYGPDPEQAAGRIALTYSGGLAHLYLTNVPGRLGAADLDARFPGLIEKIAALDRIAFVMLRDGAGGTLVSAAGRVEMGTAAASELLARYDDPAILGPQLEFLNSFERSGEMVIFGENRNDLQVNFEHQAGGHGSIGGDQVLPFILAKRSWDLDTTSIRGAKDVYPLLKSLRDRLAGD